MSYAKKKLHEEMYIILFDRLFVFVKFCIFNSSCVSPLALVGQRQCSGWGLPPPFWICKKKGLFFHSPSPIVNWIEASTWIVLRWYYCNHGWDLFLGPPKGPGHPSQPSRRSRLSPCDLFKLAFIPNWLVQCVECGKIPEILNMCCALCNTLHIQAMHVQYLTITKIPDMCKTWYEQ